MKKIYIKVIILMITAALWLGAVPIGSAWSVYTDDQGFRYERLYSYVIYSSGRTQTLFDVAVITKYVGEDPCPVIPTSVDGRTVVAITGSGFSDCPHVRYVKIPISIEFIDDGVFRNPGHLVLEFVSQNLPEISSKAFEGARISAYHNPIGSTTAQPQFGGRAVWFREKLGEVKTFTDGGLTYLYREEEEGVTLLGCSPDAEGAVTLPAAIGGKPVTRLRTALFGCDKVTAATLPDSVAVLEDYAFADCTALTEFPAANALETVGNRAFEGCIALTAARLPDSVTLLDRRAFLGCTALVELTLPRSLKEIRAEAFKGCAALRRVDLPEGLTDLTTGLFEDCVSLEEVPIPSTVTRIMGEAFMNCTSLRTLKLPSGVRSVGASAFRGCTALEEMKLPSGVYSVSASLFEGCTSLKRVVMSRFTTAIMESAFQGCRSLTGLMVLPPELETLGKNAFAGCEQLDRVYLPETLTSMEFHAFAGCDLTSLTMLGKPTLAWPFIADGESLTVYYDASKWSTGIHNVFSSYDVDVTFLPLCREHEWAEETFVTWEPDCTTSGRQIQFCTHHDVYRELEPLPPTGHSFGEWEWVTAPTREAPGRERQVCEDCGKVIEREISFLPGDVNGDGQVNSTDARMILQLAVNKIGPDEIAVPDVPDVDRDGSITTTDARMTLQLVVGKLSELP